jgi:hypothetical protein
MPVLLLLPFKPFLGSVTWKQIDGQSHKLIRRSAVTFGVLVAFVLFVAIRFRVSEIPLKQLNAWRVPASSSVLTVEQVLVAPQAYSHRIITIRGCYVSGFEVIALRSCKEEPAEGIWIESATAIRFLEELHLMNKWSEPPVLILPYSEARGRQVWRRFSGALENVQNATLIGQFETRASVAGKGNRGFGHMGQYAHELILEDVLLQGGCDNPACAESKSVKSSTSRKN